MSSTFSPNAPPGAAVRGKAATILAGNIPTSGALHETSPEVHVRRAVDWMRAQGWATSEGEIKKRQENAGHLETIYDTNYWMRSKLLSRLNEMTDRADRRLNAASNRKQHLAYRMSRRADSKTRSRYEQAKKDTEFARSWYRAWDDARQEHAIELWKKMRAATVSPDSFADLPM